MILNRAGSRRVADGRSRDAADVIACASTWLAHGDLDRLAVEVPFIGKKDRAMCALAGRLDPGAPLGNRKRSCERIVGVRRRSVLPRWWHGETAFACGFFLGQAQVALWDLKLGNIPAAVAAWLIARVSVRLLATHVAWGRARTLRRRAGDRPATMALVTRSGSHLKSERCAGAPARADREARNQSGCHNFLYVTRACVLALLFRKLARSRGSMTACPASPRPDDGIVHGR